MMFLQQTFAQQPLDQQPSLPTDGTWTGIYDGTHNYGSGNVGVILLNSQQGADTEIKQCLSIADAITYRDALTAAIEHASTL